jgi:hypothetical protein
MKTLLHRAETRGHVNHGWLDTHHTFSFAGYWDPERIQFGMLRVLNDDVISRGMGFGNHPHANMEIITIPLYGDLEHKDSMGNISVIKEGDIQVMSAGTGISHSEYNKNRDKEVQLLQIWIIPNRKNVEPRYDQISLEDVTKKNKLYQVLSPDKHDEGVWIYQDAWFHMGKLTKGWQGLYQLKVRSHGVYLFIIEGKIRVGDQELNKRDGFGIWDTESIEIMALDNSFVLLMEVPMST